MNVYVIMPVESDRDFTLKRTVLAEVANRAGADLHLPLEHSHEGDRTRAAVLNELASADLVIVDLSLERPSCYFELGLAQALGRPTFVIASAGTDIHQLFGRALVREFASFADYESLIETALNA